MKSIVLSILFSIAIFFATACSTSREVSVREREERDDGTVVKRERRVDDDGIVIKKRKRDRDILDEDEDDRDVDIRIKRNRDNDPEPESDDEPAIIIRKDD